VQVSSMAIVSAAGSSCLFRLIFLNMLVLTFVRLCRFRPRTPHFYRQHRLEYLAASIFASVLIPPPEKQVDPTVEIGQLKTELAAVREELTAVRELLTVDRRGDQACPGHGRLGPSRRSAAALAACSDLRRMGGPSIDSGEADHPLCAVRDSYRLWSASAACFPASEAGSMLTAFWNATFASAR